MCSREPAEISVCTVAQCCWFGPEDRRKGGKSQNPDWLLSIGENLPHSQGFWVCLCAVVRTLWTVLGSGSTLTGLLSVLMCSGQDCVDSVREWVMFHPLRSGMTCIQPEVGDVPSSQVRHDLYSTRPTLSLLPGQPCAHCWEMVGSWYQPLLAMQCHLEVKLESILRWGFLFKFEARQSSLGPKWMHYDRT